MNFRYHRLALWVLLPGLADVGGYSHYRDDGQGHGDEHDDGVGGYAHERTIVFGAMSRAIYDVHIQSQRSICHIPARGGHCGHHVV